MIKKKLIFLMIVAFVLFAGAIPASAHVSVKPSQVGAAERVNFVVGVPTEEEDPTVQVRLVIPEGLQSVTPFVKPGWSIELKKTGEGEEAKVTEIIWSGGSIPAERRDEFVFSAQAPAEETNLVWKAYQTYGDGDIVAWENDPKVVAEYTKKNPPKEGHEDDHNAPRPYSETKVINDLKASAPQEQETTNNKQASSSQTKNSAEILGYVAIALSIAAIGIALSRRKN